EAERCLAGTRFTDDPQGLSRPHLNVYAVDRLHIVYNPAKKALSDGKPDLDIVAGHDRRRFGVRCGWLAFRLGSEQLFCIGVLWVGENLRRRTMFDDMALSHHAN